jgi:putative DNA primase/helicase
MTPTELRLLLYRSGYHPLPLNGKNPSIRPGWQNGFDLNEGEIELWGQTWPYATNTGVLARYTPCLDIDILNPEAADAAEALVREHYEDRGYFLVRIGLPPKRLIPFRTDEPFKKINVPLIAVNETDPKRREQKIEFLADGQQFVAFGIHPGTHKPYTWPQQSLLEVPRGELPYIRQAEAQTLVDELAALITDENNKFGYQPKNHKKSADPKDDPKDKKERADWAKYLNNLIDDDSNTAFAYALLKSGMSDGAAVNFLTAAVENLKDVDEGRRQRRLKNIAGQMKSARRKINEEANPNETLDSIRADSVEMTSIRWLWPGRFAYGKLGLIAGLPDEGKGQIFWYLTAMVTTGGLYPCDEGKAPLGNVVILEAEDDLSDTVKPRLAAAGADLSRVHIINMVRNSKDKNKRMFSLITDLPMLRQKVEEIGDVALILIDPMSAYLGRGKIDTFRTTDVRAVLGPFVDLAVELKVAIIGILHFNKRTDVTNVLLRVSDSLAFAATARHVYGVVNDPANKRKLLVRGKNNAASPEQKALAYHFGMRMVGLGSNGEEIWAPHVIWEPDHVDVTATEAMLAAETGRPPAERDSAKALLQKMLADGPMPMKDILEAALAEKNISKRTLYRAKDELGIEAIKDGPGGTWRWHPAKKPGSWHDDD